MRLRRVLPGEASCIRPLFPGPSILRVLSSIATLGVVSVQPAGAASRPPALGYAVDAGPGAAILAVEAHKAGLGDLTFDDGLGRFVTDPETWDGRGWQPMELHGDLLLRGKCGPPCRFRYRFRLQEAARTLRDPQRAVEHTGALLAPPSSWLARPVCATAGGRYRLTVRTPPGISFVTGVFPSPGAEPDTYEADVADLAESPYSGFGAFATSAVAVPGGTVVLAVAPGALDLPAGALTSWVEESARAVAGYYGRFPVPRVLVMVLPGGQRPIGFGTTLGNGGASIMVWVGRSAREKDLASDWVLTHEMVHLGIPNLPRTQHWLEEGLATYIEPLARARQRRLAEKEVWHDLMVGLPKGLPEPGDQGLNRTHTWGRTYWGGALFSFLADLEIRHRTGGRAALDDALRGVVQSGGSIAVSWPIERFLREADRATGTTVLADLYQRHAEAAAGVDLSALWRQLGVSVTAEGVRFDDGAPLAAVRRGLTSPPSSARP